MADETNNAEAKTETKTDWNKELREGAKTAGMVGAAAATCFCVGYGIGAMLMGNGKAGETTEALKGFLRR